MFSVWGSLAISIFHWFWRGLKKFVWIIDHSNHFWNVLLHFFIKCKNMHLKSVSRMGQCHVWDNDFCIHYGQEVDYSGFKGYALKVSCIKALLIIITKRKKSCFIEMKIRYLLRHIWDKSCRPNKKKKSLRLLRKYKLIIWKSYYISGILKYQTT